MTLTIEFVPLFKDNYAYLLIDQNTKMAAVIDPGDGGPVLTRIRTLNMSLSYVLITHHHADHVGGVEMIKQLTGACVVGSAVDVGCIPKIDLALKDREKFALGESIATVLALPGHTQGHIAYYFAENGAVFCGDVLFSLGCGRIIDGSPRQMLQSLDRLAALPPATSVYCGHEYSAANAAFALNIDPSNKSLQARARAIAGIRAEGKPTLPSTIGIELAANPFLRVREPAIIFWAGEDAKDDVAVFERLRSAKDLFRH